MRCLAFKEQEFNTNNKIKRVQLSNITLSPSNSDKDQVRYHLNDLQQIRLRINNPSLKRSELCFFLRHCLAPPKAFARFENLKGVKHPVGIMGKN